MKGIVIDSTYKEDIIIGLNDLNTIVPNNNIPSNSLNNCKVGLSNLSPNYLSHSNKSDKFNTYSIVDYL